MKRKLLLSVAFIALLAGCKDDEATANEKLTQALEHVVAAQSASTQTEAHDGLVAARDLLAEVRADLPGTAAALKIVSGETIGTVDLSQLDAMIATAQRGKAQENCFTSPNALCLWMFVLEAEASRAGVTLDEFLRKQGDPQDFLNYFTLIDGGPEAAKALAGQARTAPDREMSELMYAMLREGHEETLKTWLTVTTPAPGSVLRDWQSFLELAPEFPSRGNLVQHSVTIETVARLAKTEGEKADALVTRIGGLEALRIALGDAPIEKLAEWRGKKWVRPGSDAEGMIAVLLWDAGEQDAARAIFGTSEMASNDFVIHSLPLWVEPEVRRELLLAVLPMAKDPVDRARIVMALIALGTDEAAGPALAQMEADTAEDVKSGSELLPPGAVGMTLHLVTFAQSAGIGLGRGNARALMDRVLALPEANLPVDARQRMEQGWLIGRALAGDTDRLKEAIRAIPDGQAERFLRDLLWEMLELGQAEEATALFNSLVDKDETGARADEDGYLMEAALLAGRFTFAKNALRKVDYPAGNPERALRLRLKHAPALDDAALFSLLTDWQQRAFGRGIVAQLAETNRFTGRGYPELAARVAVNLEGESRLDAIAELARVWPGRAQN